MLPAYNHLHFKSEHTSQGNKQNVTELNYIFIFKVNITHTAMSKMLPTYNHFHFKNEHTHKKRYEQNYTKL
jgi:hypothetical protein